jgi:hypothetical protein
MKKLRVACLLAVLFSLSTFFAAFAQKGELSLRMSRDWGYGGLNGDIEGLFSMHVTGPADLTKVEFYIDDTKIGQVNQGPFNLQFNTDNYALGSHQLYAIGYSTNGQVYRSNIVTGNFVPKQSSMKVVLPVLGIIFAAVLLSAIVPFLAGRRKGAIIPLGSERNYGMGGGGICPNCHRPFALPLFSAHLGFSKLAVCPSCGKWNLVRVQTIDKLREAEKAELEWSKPGEAHDASEDEKLRKEINDSKYQDS